MTSEKLVAVYEAATEVQAVLYRSVLEEAGIDVYEEPTEVDLFVGVRQRGLHSRLMVRPEDAERAADLVTTYMRKVERGELTVEDAPSRE